MFLQRVRFRIKYFTTGQILKKDIFLKGKILKKKVFLKGKFWKEIIFKKHDVEKLYNFTQQILKKNCAQKITFWFKLPRKMRIFWVLPAFLKSTLLQNKFLLESLSLNVNFFPKSMTLNEKVLVKSMILN